MKITGKIQEPLDNFGFAQLVFYRFELIENGRGIRPDDAVATGPAKAGRMTGANSCPAYFIAGRDEEDAGSNSVASSYHLHA
jgi:hypothetical protein